MGYRLFISYAEEDRRYRKRLQTHLAQPIRDGHLTVWSDRMIVPGEKWDVIIREQIRTCDAVVFLISADFFNSDYIHGVEMQIARERLARGEVAILPVPLFPSFIDRTWLAAHEALWNPERPIGILTDRGAQERAWNVVARNILNAAAAAVLTQHPAPLPRGRTSSRRPPVTEQKRFRRSAQMQLLAGGGFFGREQELFDLNSWIEGTAPIGNVRLVVLRALGGMGKSVLAWHWSQKCAPEIGMKRGYEGVFWWSFYARGSDIRAFVREALAFMGVSADDMPAGLEPRLQRLAELCTERAAIFVLDGFERELRAFSRRDAPDDPEAAAHQANATRPYDCVDPETDAFLARIAGTFGASRWLMTTRVIPTTLVDLGAVQEIELGGLSRSATRALFGQQGVTGSEQAFAEVEKQFGGHGLTLSVLARTLIRHGMGDLDAGARDAGGFDRFWRDVTGQPDEVHDEQAARRLRVLMNAVETLSPASRDVLQSFTFVENAVGLRMLEDMNSHLARAEILDALEELRSHGVLTPSDNAFVYELHPVMRDAASRFVTGAGVARAIDAFEKLGADRQFASLDEAQHTIDLYRALIKAGRFDAAYNLYFAGLGDLLDAGGNAERRATLLGLLFDENLAPRLRSPEDQSNLIDGLCRGLSNAGRFGDSCKVAERLWAILPKLHDPTFRLQARLRLSYELRLAGRIAGASRALNAPREIGAPTNWQLLYDVEYATLNAYTTGNHAAVLQCADATLPRLPELDSWSRDVVLNDLSGLAWRLRDPGLNAQIAAVQRRASSGRGAFPEAARELHRLRNAFVNPGVLNDAEIVRAARDLRARFAELDLTGWVPQTMIISAMASARCGANAARRAAEDLRAIASRYERSEGMIVAADTWLEAAQAWILGGNFDAARTDATRGRKLAYGDGPPYTAKFLEDRADELLRRLSGG